MKYTVEDICTILDSIQDPEIPVLSLNDLGIIRQINIIDSDTIEVKITPTYSGCPAMGFVTSQIRFELVQLGFVNIKITETLQPAWTTDWMTEEGKKKLEEYGIAPPRLSTKEDKIRCPQCKSESTTIVSEFGSTSCKALYKCMECLEPFDYFKCI